MNAASQKETPILKRSGPARLRRVTQSLATTGFNIFGPPLLSSPPVPLSAAAAYSHIGGLSRGEQSNIVIGRVEKRPKQHLPA